MNRPTGQGGGGQISPGVVCCVATEIGDGDAGDGDGGEDGEGEGGADGDMDIDVDEEEINLDDTEALIKGFWGSIRGGVDRLGAKVVAGDIREVMQEKSMVVEDIRAKRVSGRKSEDAVVRMWCEVLRLRG